MGRGSQETWGLELAQAVIHKEGTDIISCAKHCSNYIYCFPPPLGCRQFEDMVGQQHEVGQAIGRLDVPLGVRAPSALASLCPAATDLRVRFLRVAPLLPGVDAPPDLQPSVQYGEVCQGVGKLGRKTSP